MLPRKGSIFYFWNMETLLLIKHIAIIGLRYRLRRNHHPNEVFIWNVELGTIATGKFTYL